MSRPLSPMLRQHVAGSFDRPHILTSVMMFAESLPAGTRVLDAGAGYAPFRELFSRREGTYITVDWEHSVHPEAQKADIIAPLDSLPLPDGSVDAVLCTQVLEHVVSPTTVLKELRRVLTPSGTLLLTVPFVGELHEEPFDYFRYTPHSLRVLLKASGFQSIEIQPLGGAFTVAAHLVRHWVTLIGATGGVGRLSEPLLWRLGPLLRRLDRFDRRHILSLGFAVRAIASE
jgi:SAM-dependent methyltransferase